MCLCERRRLGLVTASLMCFLFLLFSCSALTCFIGVTEFSSKIEFLCLKLFVIHLYWGNTSTYCCCKQHCFVSYRNLWTCFTGTCLWHNKIHLYLEQRDKAWLNTGLFLFKVLLSFHGLRVVLFPCLLSCFHGLGKFLECNNSVNVNFVPVLCSV